MVRWAPFNIPFARRLETGAVLFWMFSSPVCALPVFFFIMFLSHLFLITIPIFWIYVIWALFYDDAPKKGGRPIKSFRKWKLYRYLANYFPVSLVKTVDLPKNKNYLFCYHPHGIISVGAISNFCSDATGFDKQFPDVDLRVGTLDINFRVPFYREWLLSNSLVSVSYASCLHNLTRSPNASMMIVVGGAKESLDAHPGTSDLTLKNRKGFVKLALHAGANLVPIFSFGENDVWDQIENPPGSTLRTWQDRFQEMFGFALPLLTGRGIFNYDFGLFPFRRRIVSVIGNPIEVPEIPSPSQADIDKWHQIYLDALSDLYEANKDKYYKHRKRDLVIK